MRTVSLAASFFALGAFAGEGKWTPAQVLDLGPKWVKEQGFQLPLTKLWDKKKGTGLLSNAVQLPGCSGAFVSADGLLITNHHCVVSILQEHSTPGANLFEDGYLAKTRADEKASKAFRIQVPRAFRDVTAQVRAKLGAAASDLERYRALEAVQNELVAACEKEPPVEGASSTRCTFATFDGGVSFNLTVFDELADVRLVWAPPRGVGEYGGEIDNWSWPRHTGDFSLVRAYTTKGAPYRPQYFFPLSVTGVKAGDAVAVLGYPGISYRGLLAREMQERAERWFPAREKFTAEWMAVLEGIGKWVQFGLAIGLRDRHAGNWICLPDGASAGMIDLEECFLGQGDPPEYRAVLEFPGLLNPMKNQWAAGGGALTAAFRSGLVSGAGEWSTRSPDLRQLFSNHPWTGGFQSPWALLSPDELATRVLTAILQ